MGGLSVALPIVATLLAVVAVRVGTRGGIAAPVPAPQRPVTAAADPPPAPAGPRDAVPARQAAAVPTRRSAPAGGAAEPATSRRRPTRGPEPDRTRPEPEIDAADAIAVLREEGETGGIAAFGLPGTDPPKPGLIVPEGFELPEGYVRHYQTTDDGERLPAILMVHPDYELRDAQGRPVPTEDGVVPPELAPPGLPIEILEVPGRRTTTTDAPP
jgi:hypothetical protein